MTTPQQARELAKNLRTKPTPLSVVVPVLQSLADQVEALTAENAQIRELMNLYNLGGWTDSLTLMQERDSLINLLENSWQGWFPAVHDGAGYDRHEFVFKSSERDLRAAIAKETA